MNLHISRILLHAIALIVFIIPAHSQVVINEILLNDQYLEIKNVADTPVNVSQYYYAWGDESQRIGSRFTICGSGNYIIAPGAILGFFAFNNNIEASGGELILFNSDDLSNPDAVLHYVQWGSAGHAYEALADVAGYWTTGDFVPAYLDGGSLEFDGDGYSSSDWDNAAVNSMCSPNGTGCDSIPFNAEPYDVPVLFCIGDGEPDYLDYTFNGNIYANLVSLVLNGNNTILGFADLSQSVGVDVEYLTPADTAGIHTRLLGYNGPIGLLEVGNNLDTLVGCFYYSDPFPMVVGFIESGTLTATYLDTVYIDSLSLCATDNIQDIIKFDNSAGLGQKAYVAYNDDDGIVFALGIDSLTLDLGNTPYVDIVAFSFTYQGVVLGDVGDPYFSISGYPCAAYADNLIQIKTDACINSSATLSSEFSTIQIRPNPSSFEIHLTGLPDETNCLELFNQSGQIMQRTEVNNAEQGLYLPVGHLSPGLYLVSLSGKGFRIQQSFMRN